MEWPLADGTLVALASAALSWIIVEGVRRGALRHGWTAPVRGDRWHTDATPLFGGAGIALAFVVSLGVTRGISGGFRDATSQSSQMALALIGGALRAALVGVVDDIVHFRPPAKLAAQTACACAFLWGCGGVVITGAPALDTAIAIVWIVAMMNALNMLDNMDGVAASAAVMGLAACAVAALASPGGLVVGIVASAGAGVAGGFLVQNWPRARIFMGDGGSLMLGFLLAALPLAWGREWTMDSVAIGWLAIAVAAVGVGLAPLVDMIVVSSTRTRRGQSPLVGGRDHTTHRLALRGWSGPRVALAVSIAAALGGAMVVSAARGWLALPVAGGVVGLVLVGAVAGLVRLAIAMDDAAHVARADAAHRREAYEPFAKAILDVSFAAAALSLGYFVRWDWTIPPELTNSISWSLPLVIACCVSANCASGSYWRKWHGASFAEVGLRVAWACAGSGLSFVVVSALWSPDRLFSRLAMGIFVVVYPVIVLAAMCTFRTRWR